MGAISGMMPEEQGESVRGGCEGVGSATGGPKVVALLLGSLPWGTSREGPACKQQGGTDIPVCPEGLQLFSTTPSRGEVSSTSTPNVQRLMLIRLRYHP